MSKKTTQTLPKPEHFDLETEMAFLGSILVSGSHANKVMDKLTDITYEMFYTKFHQQVFLIFVMLWQTNSEISTITVVDYAKQFDIEGVDQYSILSLAAKSSLLSGMKAGEDIIKRMHSERNIIALSQNIQNLAKNEAQMENNVLEIEKEIDIFKNQKEGIQIKSMSNLLDNWLNTKEEDPKPATSFGLSEFEEKNVSMSEGHLVILAARPKVGKTSLSLVASLNICQTKKVLYFSLEMTEMEILDRIIAYKANLNPSITSYFGKDQTHSKKEILEAIQELKKDKIDIIADPTIDIWRINSICKRENKKEKLGLIVIDQLSHIKTNGQFDNRQNNIAAYDYIVKNLKALALETKCPIMLLHQINRAVENRDDKKPQMQDLKDCGTVEECADLLLLMSKDEKKTENQVHISVVNRHGSSCEINLNWDKKLAKINSKSLKN